MRHNLLVEWHSVEIFSIRPDDRGGLYSLLTAYRDEHENPHLLFVPTPLTCFYYRRFFRRESSYDIQRVITLVICELAILEGIQLLLYAAEGAAEV